MTLKTRCRVREITVGENGLASGVIYYDADGVERRQKAEVVVLACNGIGTPRLLLNSRSKQFPDGLANRSGLLGKRLMFHPYAMVTGLFPESLEGYKGPTGCCIMSQEFYDTDTSRDFTRGYSFEMLRGFGPVYSALWGMQAGRLSWGADHHRDFADVFDRTAGMVVICEDLPDEGNSVTLDPALADADGIPAPKITYRLSENDRDGRRVAAAPGGMAPHGHRAHGDGSPYVGRELVGPVSRRPQPVHHRRQHLRDRGGREPHEHDPGAGALHRRHHEEEPRHAVRRLT